MWYDASGGLHGGDEWWDIILRELISRDTLIVILSPVVLASQWVRDEMCITWGLRHELSLSLIPVLREPCERWADFALLLTHIWRLAGRPTRIAAILPLAKS
ncbi:MAG: toll/interleukin-1 receptor domain-containing protein [Ktedonobacterales bacterium]|nr:toll/interleukin-1 receptor domain-containing protein [Ktedonobacterales bacterium]